MLSASQDMYKKCMKMNTLITISNGNLWISNFRLLSISLERGHKMTHYYIWFHISICYGFRVIKIRNFELRLIWPKNQVFKNLFNPAPREKNLKIIWWPT